MRKKALDVNPLAYMTMMVCHELGKTESEVSSWSLADLFRWIAYFRLKNKAEAKAYERARNKQPTGGTGKNTKVTIE